VSAVGRQAAARRVLHELSVAKGPRCRKKTGPVRGGRVRSV
jgi:hypothetical protein